MTLCWSLPPSPWAAALGRGTRPSLGPQGWAAAPTRAPAGAGSPRVAPPHLPGRPLPTSPATCSSSFSAPPRALAAPDPQSREERGAKQAIQRAERREEGTQGSAPGGRARRPHGRRVPCLRAPALRRAQAPVQAAPGRVPGAEGGPHALQR